MENLEQLIKIPLQTIPLEELIPEIENFNTSCNAARDYLLRLRVDTKEIKLPKGLQAKDETQVSPLCKHLIGILKIYVQDSLPKILIKWERTLTRGASSTATVRLDDMKVLSQVLMLGLEMFLSVINLIQVGITKKQKFWEETVRFCPTFRKLNDIILSKPSLMLLGEYQILSADIDDRGEAKRIIPLLDTIYKEVWRLVYYMKKTNQLIDSSDLLLNTLEIGLIEMFDSTEVSHNILGHELALVMFGGTHNEYYVSLLNVISTWNQHVSLNNLGRLYQLIFLFGNEDVRERILIEIEGLEPEEMLKFLELFDAKMYDGFLEEKSLFDDEKKITHKKNYWIDKLALPANLVGMLHDLFNDTVNEDLINTHKALKNVKPDGQDPKERKRFITLLKITSISTNMVIFAPKTKGSLSKLQENALKIIEESFKNPEETKDQIMFQIMIDIYHSIQNKLKGEILEQILDVAGTKGDTASLLFCAKIASFLSDIKFKNDIQNSNIAQKIQEIFHSMLNDRDSLARFKAIEGIMLMTNNNPNLTSEQRASLLPPKNQDKELLAKMKETKPEQTKNKGMNLLFKEMVGNMGKRFKKVEEDCLTSRNRFATVEKEYPFDLGSKDVGPDAELNKAFKYIEDLLSSHKKETLTPREQCKKVLMKNKIMGLLTAFKQAKEIESAETDAKKE